MKLSVRGFTFVELLMVISIMAIMAVVSFAKFAPLKEEQTLKAVANQLQSLVRTAQTNATTGVKCSSIQTDPSGTWFVEYKDNKNFDLKCYITSPDSPTIVRTLSLEHQVEVVSISGTGNCIDPVRIQFAPLSGTVKFFDKSPPFPECVPNDSNLLITLQKNGGTVIKSISITKGGSVEIK